MSPDTKLAMMMIVVGFVGFPLACWLFCLWVDYSDGEVARRCRRANRRYFKWEQEQKMRKRRK